jgi:glycosyltransferase involved in cell wall biosynthesis
MRDEAPHLAATIHALLTSLDGSGFNAELVVVDDGSSDGSADAVRYSVDGHIPLSVVRRGGEGRFEARRAGLEAASGELALGLPPGPPFSVSNRTLSTFCTIA